MTATSHARATTPRRCARSDAVMHQAVATGAGLVKAAHKTFWGGYAGYFQDPDDHLWEVVFNPAFLPEE
jgi:uncharacterized protein